MMIIRIALVAMCYVIGINLIAAFVYIRMFMITDDAFDPLRLKSIDILLLSSLAFITGSMFCFLGRSR